MRERQRYDVWAAGAAYERYMGRWSRLVADRFLPWLDAADGLRWLDVGCGTGGLTAAIAARRHPTGVLGVDRSEGFVARARTTASPPARFAVADAQALPVRDATCDATVSALLLNFLPSPAAALAEQTRVTRRGGLVAAYVWDYAGGMELLRHFWDAATAVDPAAAPLHEGRRFADCRPDRLRAVWTAAGLTDVATTGLDVPTVFAGFDELWAPFLSGQGPAPGYLASLPPATREHVRDALSAALPRDPDGTIPLTARAWAVRGRRTPRQRGDGGGRVRPSATSTGSGGGRRP
ncbi:class I SAM-dependent methyltransferase [Streptomyces sp. NPDC085529]|uniref:class I SAM-dependent methyltransferase n=1 Tax=Streptomyces sp. NPDC085529 TaxID=3365729 RepID=UPI0037D2C9E4